jgi:hypothetical protein
MTPAWNQLIPQPRCQAERAPGRQDQGGIEDREGRRMSTLIPFGLFVAWVVRRDRCVPVRVPLACPSMRRWHP